MGSRVTGARSRMGPDLDLALQSQVPEGLPGHLSAGIRLSKPATYSQPVSAAVCLPSTQPCKDKDRNSPSYREQKQKW